MGEEPNLDRLRNAYELINHDPKKALSELDALISEGSILAHVYLGCMLANGTVGPKDDQKAEMHLRKAFDAGSEEGIYQLGMFYWRKKEYSKAEVAFHAGATKGYLPAVYWLARVVEQTPAYPERDQVMISLFEEAAKRGHLYAQKRMIGILLDKRFNKKNVFRALLLYLNLLIRAPSIVFKNEFDSRIR